MSMTKSLVMKAVDASKYISLIKDCILHRAWAQGRTIHANIIKSGHNSANNRALQNTLMNLYAKNGDLTEAQTLFNEIPCKNECSWGILISGFAKHGDDVSEVLKLFDEMKKQPSIKPNHFIFSSVISAIANRGSLRSGTDIHEEAEKYGIETHISVSNALVDMYGKFGNMDFARQVFDKMPTRDVVTWTAMISGFLSSGLLSEATEMFRRIPSKDAVVCNIMITGFMNSCLVDEAVQVFDEMPHRDLFSWNSMLSGYLQNGMYAEALEVFNRMPKRTEVSWNTMVAGYARAGMVDEAIRFLGDMPCKSVVSWNGLLAGLIHNGMARKALEVFGKMPQKNIMSWNTVLAGCANTGMIDEAVSLFEKMPKKNLVSWTALIVGFVQKGMVDDASNAFREMQMCGVETDPKALASILPVCVTNQHGKEIHEHIIRSGLHSNVFLANGLIDLYGKHGGIGDARKVFDRIPKKCKVSWTAMISGYAMHGLRQEALTLFDEMKRLSDVVPDHVTWLCVLGACNHAGLASEGKMFYNSMIKHYNISPTMDHYQCMVDLLGRAQLWDEALGFIQKMPQCPDASVWISLLGACSRHSNVALGEYVAQQVFTLDPQNSTAHVLLSNMYAAAGRWDKAESTME